RGIENRRSLYRCTATGLTTASDITGKVLVKSKMWSEEIVKARLPLYGKKTIYGRIGELFSYVCIGILLVIIVIILRAHFIKIKIKDEKNKKTRKIYLRELKILKRLR
nr:hypothetical protein [Spirochaetota bacterium]